MRSIRRITRSATARSRERQRGGGERSGEQFLFPRRAATKKSFLFAQSGVAMVEFALVLPLLMTMFYGVIEITRYVLIAQKAEKFAYSVANVTSQETVATKANLDAVMGASAYIMQPYTTGTNTRVIITSMYRPANPSNGTSTATANWQYAGGGTLAATSAMGAVGGAPNMPAGFTVDERENVISAEVFYQFSPLLTTRWFGTTTLYRVSYFKPRLAALTAAPV